MVSASYLRCNTYWKRWVKWALSWSTSGGCHFVGFRKRARESTDIREMRKVLGEDVDLIITAWIEVIWSKRTTVMEHRCGVIHLMIWSRDYCQGINMDMMRKVLGEDVKGGLTALTFWIEVSSGAAWRLWSMYEAWSVRLAVISERGRAIEYRG